MLLHDAAGSFPQKQHENIYRRSSLSRNKPIVCCSSRLKRPVSHVLEGSEVSSCCFIYVVFFGEGGMKSSIMKRDPHSDAANVPQ